MKTVARMASFVHDILSGAELRPAAASIVRSLLGGITATGSVVLSEILRPQVDKDHLHAAEQRVSQALKNDTSFDRLTHAYLGLLAPVASTMPFRSVDGSDVSKPASRETEFLDVVRDSSAKPRTRVAVGPKGVQPACSVPWSPKPKAAKRPKRRRRAKTPKPKTSPSTGRRRAKTPAAPKPRPQRARTQTRKADRAAFKDERKAARAAAHNPSPPVPSAVSPPTASVAEPAGRFKFPSPPALKKLGYWMVQIVVSDGKGNHLPLAQDIFSTQDPSYQALGEGAWTKTFQLSIERVIEHVGRGGCWQMDRGFDDVAWMNWMGEHVDQYNIRIKNNRRVRPGTREAEPVDVDSFAQTLAAHHTTQSRYVDKSSHQEKFRAVLFGWAPIWIDGVDHGQYLIVVHTGRKRHLLLVTNKRPENAEQVATLIAAYMERWGNEEVTRACKQLTGLERIRVRSMAALRRLVWLAMIAVGLQALSILTCGRLTRATLDRAKEFIKTVRFVLYRIWRVVQEDILHALKCRSPVLLS